MPQAEAITRPIFYTLPTWLTIVFYVVGVSAVILFLLGSIRNVRIYRAGRKDPREKLTFSRLFGALPDVLLMRKLFRVDRYTATAHFCVFWGFAGLVIATLIVLVENDVLAIFFPEYMFMHGTFYLVFSLGADISGVLFLAGRTA